MTDPQVLELFSIVIYKKNLPDYPDKDSIINDTDLYRDDVSSCWASHNKDVLLQYPNLQSVIMNEFKIYAEDVLEIDTSKIEFYISRSWIIKHALNDFSQPHRHINSFFSGILYMNVDDDSGNLAFPRYDINSIAPHNFEFDYKKHNQFNAPLASMTPKNGDLFFFPSHVYHQVTQNKSTIDRYVLVFDIFFKGKLGNDMSKLTV